MEGGAEENEEGLIKKEGGNGFLEEREQGQSQEIGRCLETVAQDSGTR